VNLLEQIQAMAEQKGFSCANIDATIVAQEPKLSPYAEAMSEKISRCLKIDNEAVNIKAKTTEGLGFEGSGEGMSAYVVVLMKKT
jgi:2-C-methyl-D-erythritol 2,4-cyclodiphosphate synthase